MQKIKEIKQHLNRLKNKNEFFQNIIDRNNDYLFSPSSKINKKTNKIGYADNYNTNENKINRSNSFVKVYCSNLFYPPFCENIKQPIKTSNKKTIYNRLFEDGKIRINQKSKTKKN